MNQKLLYKVFIWGFLFLYLLVAAISFFHAIQFFNVGNNIAMSVVLAFAFEIGLALSLAAVLLSDANKKATLPWILMIVLTSVQVIGNVFSTFKYMSLSGTEYYQYLAKPLLFWIEGVSEDTVQIVVSWIIGAILPIIALFMTDMVATNIKNLNSEPATSPESKKTIDYKVDTDDEEEEERHAVEGLGNKTQETVVNPANHDLNEYAESLKDPFEGVSAEKADETIPTTENASMEEKRADNEVFTNPAVSETGIPAEKQSRFKKWAESLKQMFKEKK